MENGYFCAFLSKYKMATVAINIRKNQRKKDGTYNVKIRITHKQSSYYLKTHHYVYEEQLYPDFTLRDSVIKGQLSKTLQKYRYAIGKLDDVIDYHSVVDVKDHLINLDKDVDFIRFCKRQIDDLLEAGRKGSARTFQTVMYSLVDYLKKNVISALEINERELISYEKYLRSKRIQTRICNKTIITKTVEGMSDAGVYNHMRDLRTLFKAAMRFFNNPQFDDIKIRYCPFDNYKLVAPPITKKRNIKIHQVREIRDSQARGGSRAELARDMFMLSFYLCGMNAVDIYNLRTENIIDGRIEYNRSKTKRRKDNAFISIKIIKDAEPLLSKYVNKLHRRYSNSQNLNHAISAGLKKLAKANKVSNVTLYWARHSFGNIARNKCRMSKDDVALALNHSDSYHKITDIYLEKDWDIVDEVQGKVVGLLNA
jgi:integrase